MESYLLTLSLLYFLEAIVIGFNLYYTNKILDHNERILDYVAKEMEIAHNERIKILQQIYEVQRNNNPR